MGKKPRVPLGHQKSLGRFTAYVDGFRAEWGAGSSGDLKYL